MEQFFAALAAKLVTQKMIGEYDKLQKEEVGTLRVPKAMGILGLVVAIFFCILTGIVLFFSGEDAFGKLFCSLIFGAFILLGLFLFLYQLNHLVIYRKGEITVRNIFRVVSKYDCKEIKEAFWTDRGGVRFIFHDGRRLTFDKEEECFYRQIISNEKIHCKYRGESEPVIKVTFHPFIMVPLGGISLLLVVLAFLIPELIWMAVIMVLICLALHFTYTEENKKTHIWTRRIIGIKKTYDMKKLSIDKIYEDGFLMKITIYDGKKKVGSVPVSVEYKNRAEFINAMDKNRKR